MHVAPHHARARRTVRLATVAVITAVLGSVLVVAGGTGAAHAAGSSLAGESFTGASVADSRWIALGSACLTGASGSAGGSTPGPCTSSVDAPTPGTTPGYLQLTDDTGTQSGSVLYNRPLPSSAGIDVQFDTYQYAPHSGGADGIGFFLTDGAYTLSAAGPSGGSLGYTSRTDGGGQAGVANGYLGVGLDVYGNNSNTSGYQGTGCSASSPAVAQSIAVHGPGDGMTGYCLLNSTTAASVQAGATLDATGSSSTPIATLISQSKRAVRITVSPTTQANPDPTVNTYIDFSGGSNYQLVSSVVVPSPAPASFKLGFSGSTGGSLETHLVNNVSVSTINPVGDVTLTSAVDHSTTTGTQHTTFTAGDTLPVQLTVTSTGANPLSGIAVTDPDLTNISCPATTLAVADSMTCTGSRVLTDADVSSGSYSTTATVSATDSSGTVSSSSPVTVSTYLAAIGVTQTASPASVTAAGQTVQFTSTLSNTGTEPLTSVAAASSAFTGSGTLPAPRCAAATLAVGAHTTCTTAYTTTQADVEAGTVQETVRGTASYNGTAVAPQTATTSVTATSLPALALSATVSPSPITAAGQPVTYSFLVANTGNRALQGVTIASRSFSGTGIAPAVSCPGSTLAVSTSETCTATYRATQADVDAGDLTLTADVTGTTADGASTASPQATVADTAAHGPAVALTAAATPSTVTAAGQSVTFTYTLANTGNVTLTGAAMATDTFTGSGASTAAVCSPATIPVGGIATCTTTYTVTQDDIDAGSIAATAHAIAFDRAVQVQSGTRSTPVTATQSAALSITPSAPSSYSSAGQRLRYSFVVRNTGNVQLSDVDVPVSEFDGSGTPGAADCADGRLAPNATTTCLVPYTVTAADMTAGHLGMTASATALHGTTAVHSASVSTTAAALLAPALTARQSVAPARMGAAGDHVTFATLVTNTGNVAVQGVHVDLAAFTGSGRVGGPACPSAVLPAGASETCSTDYVLTQADLDAGSVSSTAVAAGTVLTSAVSSPRSVATATAATAPALAVTTTSDATEVDQVGRVVTFTFVIRNIGAVTAMHPSLTRTSIDAAGHLSAISCPTVGSLAPKQSITCTATYTVQAADIGRTLTVSAFAEATAKDGAKTTTLPHESAVHVTSDARPATLAFTGVGPLGLVIVASAFLVLLLGATTIVLALRRRRRPV
ncbi:DUF7507 domain-containing protein [Amnibacterium kyonggiense]